MVGNSPSYSLRPREVSGSHVWSRCNRMERLLVCLLTIAILILIVLAGVVVILTVSANKPGSDVIRSSGDTSSSPREAAQKLHTDENVEKIKLPQGENICITPTCVKQAAMVLERMDLSVDPCDDFYSFACGGFVANTQIPDDRSYVDVMTKVADEVDANLQSILDMPVERNDTRPTKLAKLMYKSCLNTSRIEERGLEPMTKFMHSLGGWPVLIGPSWNENAFDWKNLTNKLRYSGGNYNLLLAVSVEKNLTNGSYRSIEIDQPQLGLDSEFLLKGVEDKLVKAYKQYQVEIAVVFGAKPEVAAEEMKKVIEFQLELAKISVPKEKRRDLNELNNEMTLADMNNKFKFVAWIDFINNILKTDTRVDGQSVVRVSVPKYIEELEKLLLKTDKRTLANYMVWRVAQHFASVLPKAVRSVAFKFKKTYDGALIEEPRWKQCLAVVGNGVLTPAVGAVYVRQFFDQESVQVVRGIVSNVQQAFQDILRKVDWMDETTRKRSLEKVEMMRFIVGYPEDLLNDTILDGYYEHIELEVGEYMENVKKMKIFSEEDNFSKLWKKVELIDWFEYGDTASANAFNDMEENVIFLQAGFLQGVMFDRRRPMYMNYGGIGEVIGHEITHGFDDMGRQYDKNGELSDWWEEETKKAFLLKTACIVEQYGNYTDEATGLRLNGVNTQGENIADNGGAKEAYNAYVEWAKQQPSVEPRLPGLESFTARQMFWVSKGQGECSKYRMEILRDQIMTDPHSPSHLRILGTLSNMEGFASDFGCPLASTMNPVRKCHVW